MRIRWTSPALSDLSLLQEYIAEDSPVAARRIVQSIRAEVNNLAAFPAMGRQGRVAETRELVVNKGRHIVVYRVRNQVIEIVAMIDARRQWPEGF
ncbi:MAG TPA: type II toxin-antitoxin system RelE/ParE family toxin [Chloroflexota bacterium]|nr:type II toxin-antitoxin system RelE/ParE family toxin [Chloroflexota bacterium]